VLAARAHVREHGAKRPPPHLRSSTRADGSYDSPHGHAGHVSAQELMPDGLAGARFYEPDEAEQALRERLEQIRRAREQA
jgi:replication-associated recombination protein RarA